MGDHNSECILAGRTPDGFLEGSPWERGGMDVMA